MYLNAAISAATSFALKMDVPATITLAPASREARAVATLIPSIHFDVVVRLVRCPPLRAGADLIQSLGDEGLPAEARIHGQHEQHIDEIQERSAPFRWAWAG